jgi:hypothetical protein
MQIHGAAKTHGLGTQNGVGPTNRLAITPDYAASLGVSPNPIKSAAGRGNARQ